MLNLYVTKSKFTQKTWHLLEFIIQMGPKIKKKKYNNKIAFVAQSHNTTRESMPSY